MNISSDASSLLQSALAYREYGLSVLPAVRSQKRPALPGWKNYQLRIPQERQIIEWFSKPEDAICVVTGQVSGNLEMLDFDRGGDRFEAWKGQIPPELLARLVIESSQSGGKHVIYRCSEPINGNMKLAMGFRDGALMTLIETRGEGGLFLCAPTSGYSLEQGSLTEIPRLTPQQREILLETAWSLSEYLPTADVPADSQFVPENRPGDDYNNRGDIRALLVKHGWSLAKKGDSELWRRPGKPHGWSASLKDKSFYVFSGNAAPLEPNRAYSPFSVYAWLEHSGDFEMAARILRQQGYGGEPTSANVIHFQQATEFVAEPTTKHGIVDPGPVPIEMLRIPGFVSEVMDLCLATAPYPNHVMAFCGAVALQAFLAGRKVRDPGDNRTNLYLLGLAHSSAGKDWPRKLNTRILFEIGAAGSLGERFSSGEGIQDALYLSPSMLFQTDEIDGMLQSMNKSRDGRHENLMSTLLTMYSSANSVYPMRRKAGKEPPGSIDQPCLVVFGTAIPNHYYEALSERMLTNGFFARMIILECGARGAGQDAKVLAIPERLLATAKWWKDMTPGNGNLLSWHPVPNIVPQSAEAIAILADHRVAAEAEYHKSESQNDTVGTTVWGRINEQARKLALLYAISENHADPLIGADAALWATEFVTHQTRRMLFMAGSHVAENPYHADCLRLIRKLQAAPDRQLPHSVLLKRMKMNAKAFYEIITTLEQQGDIVPVTGSTQGRASRGYRLVRDWSEA